MANKIRVGFVGANVRSTWSSQSHFPALLASPDVELRSKRVARLLRALRPGGAHRGQLDIRTGQQRREVRLG